jgi:hypothetical protein
MPHAFARVFDNIGFTCKIICRHKISAKAGIQLSQEFWMPAFAGMTYHPIGEINILSKASNIKPYYNFVDKYRSILA